jgi:hypothetical protein
MKVISGGQTGIDRIALEVAQSLGIKTGGTAPKDYKTENGADYSLKEFGLVESDSPEYKVRTEENIKEADLTILYGNTSSPGSRLTKSLCKQYGKHCFENPTAGELYALLTQMKVQVVNVAGNRGSRLSESQISWVKMTLKSALSRLTGGTSE